MKIVHLCLSAFFIDNCSYQENMLPKYHVKMGHEVTVIASLFTYGRNGKISYLEKGSVYNDPNGFKVIRLNYRWPAKLNKVLRHYVGLKETLELESPDIIFVHNMTFGDSGIVVDYVKKHPCVQVYADCHADYVNSGKNFFSREILNRRIRGYQAKKFEPIIKKGYGVTPMRCRYLIDFMKFDSSLIEFLPMGVDDEAIPTNKDEVRKRIRIELSIPNDAFIIFTGGKIDKLKNTHVLLDALSELSNKNIYLLICGTLTPEMDYLRERIDNNPNIHYLGWCAADRVMDCMIASDLACFPGTHSTLWEQSVGVGIPAIFKEWNEMTHVNVNNNCLLVKGDDVVELKEAINSVVFTDKYEKLKILSLKASRSFLYSEIAKKAIGG